MKKIMKLAFVAVIAAVAGYNVYQSQSVMANMSEFALANVEALANTENTETGTLYGNASGTAFCCCPGTTNSCPILRCNNC